MEEGKWRISLLEDRRQEDPQEVAYLVFCKTLPVMTRISVPELGLKYSEEGRGTTEEWVLFSVRHGLCWARCF